MPYILVNNAGITRDGLMVRMQEAQFDEVININLKGAFNMLQLCGAMMMRAKKGRIIDILLRFQVLPEMSDRSTTAQRRRA